MHPTIANCVLAQSRQHQAARQAPAGWSVRLMSLFRGITRQH